MVPAAYAIFVRFGLPESVRFLERKGRVAEAEAAVRQYEVAAGVAPVPSPAQEPTTTAPTWRDLWTPVPPPHRRAVDVLVRGQLRLLRRVRLAAVAARG